MIYKCPKCESEIRIWDFDFFASNRCDCGECDTDFGNSGNAKDYARLKDSKRWRKISEEPPKEDDGYDFILVKPRVENKAGIRLFSFKEIKHIKTSEEYEDWYTESLYLTGSSEWRPVYVC